MSKISRIALGFAGWLLPSVLLGQIPKAEEIPIPDPEIERASFKVADGFEVQLFAADPSIAKPIGMNFDNHGRLWIASSETYPQVKPGDFVNDKLIVLEDTDGNGVADKSTIFADGLFIPCGVEIGDGGVYVSNSTELLHLKDTNGDGKADQKRIVLSGFGTEDTHHTLHTLRFGPDGQLYFNQSIYINTSMETPWGPRYLGGSGTWRLRTSTMRAEVFTRGLVNPWGHTWDYWGFGFATDGAGGEGVNVYIPGGSYGNWRTDVKRWLNGVNPGSPKYCGAEIVTGRHLPDDWQGDLITNDFRANRIVRFKLREEGSGWSAKLMPDVIKSSTKGFRPIDVKMGPDGAIYIADWYNPIINHGEVDFRDPRRDHTHGRIWRIVAKGRPTLPRPNFVGATVEQLLDMLKSPESYTRHKAKREMYERGSAAVLDKLAAWLKALDPSDSQFEHNRMEALWTYQTLDFVNEPLLLELLNSKIPQARAAATRVLYYWHDRVRDPLGLVAKLIADENPKVRQEAVLVCGEMPSVNSMDRAMRVLQKPSDRYIDYSIFIVANKLKDVWLPSVLNGDADFAGRANWMAIALESVGGPEVVRPLLTLLKSGRIAPMQAEDLVSVVAGIGGPGELAELCQYAIKTGNVKLQLKTLVMLADAARARNVRPEGDLDFIANFFGSENEALRIAALRLAGEWRLARWRAGVAKLADPANPKVYAAAVEALGRMGGPESAAELSRLATAAPNVETKQATVAALAGIDVKSAAILAANLLTGGGPTVDPSSLLSAFLQKQDGPTALGDALKGKTIHADTAKLGLRHLYAVGQNAGPLVDFFRAAASVSSGVTANTPDEIKSLAAEALAKGDITRGEVVFRSKMMSCFNCHAIGGSGGQVGPDLSSVGSASPPEYLVESILLPAKNVKDGYDALAVTTKAGDFYTGIRVTQNDREIILRDALQDRIVIPKSDIKKQQPAGSLMPSGLADLLTKNEFLDLVKYLSALGTAGHDIGPSMVVRRWRIADDIKETIDPAKFDTLTWLPAYSDIAGALPIKEIPKAQTGNASYVQFEVEVTTPGAFTLKFNSADGLRLWVDGNATDAKPETTLNLPAGVHQITLQIDRSKFTADHLKVGFSEAAGSAGRGRVVGGR